MKTKIKYDNVHSYWFAFCRHFKRWYYLEYEEQKINENNEFVKTGKIIRDFDSTKMKGYQAMQRVERYVKSHPEIKIINIDDSVFASSFLVLIPHPKMGITVIFIPQCTDNQSEFFLYPNHQEYLINGIKELKKLYKVNKSL